MFFSTNYQGMARQPRPKIILWSALVFFLFLPLGCQRLQLPAIDPNGRCLFLPLTNTTQLTVPRIHSTPTEQGFLPVPAYQAPSAPPPCLDGSCESGGVCNLFHRKHDCLQKIHDHFRSAGKTGELQLTPLRVVAPVGGEVVLLAGICGEDGYLVKREPIEWMLSPDSVGQIIEVSDDAPGKLSSFFHPHRPKVEKLGVDFAKGRTSSKAQVIDRGTPNCNDDIHLRDGETWLSVSSPSAGISRITALAPESKIWDQRRQTAIIYWLDAQWEFPPPQIVKTDQRVSLRTKVTKAEGFVPAAGWLVQYTIVDPTIAAFVGPPDAQRIDERTIRTRVNNDGFGFAELAVVPGALGTTPVLIDVISPPQPDNNIPELVVGRGQTFATFSAAGLQLQVIGPAVVTKGEQVSYTATLANPGDLNAENCRLILNLAPGLRFLSASLQPSQQTDTGAVWDQGILPANRQLDVTVYAEAIAPNTYEVIFQGEANGVNAVRQTVRTEVVEPMLNVTFAPANGIAQANTGDIVEYILEVTNTGRQSLSNVKLKVKADPALVEVATGTNEVEQVIPLLQPGEKRILNIPFRIQQEGQHRAVVQVLSGNVPIVEPRVATILGLPPRPKRAEIGVEIVFPTQNAQQRTVRVGEPNIAKITLRNSGELTLTNIEVLITADENVFEFMGVDINNRPSTEGSGGRVRWNPGDLLPADRGDRLQELFLTVIAKSPSPSTTINVIARAAQGVPATATSTVEVRTSNVTPPTSPPFNQPVNPPSTPATPVFPAPSGDTAPVLPLPNNGGGFGQGNPAAPVNPAPVNPPPTAQATGKLGIELSVFNDPEVVGKQIRYGLTVANESDRVNNRVQIELRIPQGCELMGVSSQGNEIRPSFRGEGIALLPQIQTLRVGERLQYIVILKSRIPQQMRVEASVRSDLFPNPETAYRATTIIPAN